MNTKDNFFAWMNQQNHPVTFAEDADSDWKEEKVERESKGKKTGGRFKTKLSNIDKQDTLQSEPPSGFNPSMLHGKKISPQMEDVLKRLFSGTDVSDEEIEATPEWAEAMETEKKIADAMQEEHGVDRTSDIETQERKKFRAEILKAALSDKIRKTVPIGEYGIEMETNEGLKEGEEYDVERGKQVVIATGLPAAGKSTTFANPLARKFKARLCDSDIIKKVLPEFANGFGGNLVHEESSQLNEAILAEAVKRGDNIIYPILGYKPDKLQHAIEQFKKAGYTVYLCMKDQPPPIAKGRLLVRFLTKGRYLPLKCISKAQGTLGESFEKNKGNADEYIRTTNKDPYGHHETILDRSDGADRLISWN